MSVDHYTIMNSATTTSGWTEVNISQSRSSGVARIMTGSALWIIGQPCENSSLSETQVLHEKSEAYLTMLATEDVLREDWDITEEDEAWADL